MRSIPQSYIEYSKYRFEKACDSIKSAEVLLHNGDFVGANNRAYYGIFHSLRAVLALDGFDSKKHSGIISKFNLNYVKTDIFDKKMSKIISKAFEIRNDSDYEDFYVASKTDCEQLVLSAHYVLDEVRKYLINEGALDE
ncbi:MAG: HEPN domain-containing protein [Lachnospiraceae bacterium]|nr:HEPN domain-containing protein [Lachnospiraceae bacterium]